MGEMGSPHMGKRGVGDSKKNLNVVVASLARDLQRQQLVTGIVGRPEGVPRYAVSLTARPRPSDRAIEVLNRHLSERLTRARTILVGRVAPRNVTRVEIPQRRVDAGKARVWGAAGGLCFTATVADPLAAPLILTRIWIKDAHAKVAGGKGIRVSIGLVVVAHEPASGIAG